MPVSLKRPLEDQDNEDQLVTNAVIKQKRANRKIGATTTTDNNLKISSESDYEESEPESVSDPEYEYELEPEPEYKPLVKEVEDLPDHHRQLLQKRFQFHQSQYLLLI